MVEFSATGRSTIQWVAIGRGVRVGRVGRAVGAGDATATGVAGAPVAGTDVLEGGGGTGVFDTDGVAVRVGASVIVASRVAVAVGVGDLGRTAATIGGANITVTTIQPMIQPSTVPAIRASISCRMSG